MHQFHADMFDSLEFGVSSRTLCKVGSATTPTPKNDVAGPPAPKSPEPTSPAPKADTKGPTKTQAPEPKGRNTSDGLDPKVVERATKAREAEATKGAAMVREAVKDGKITHGDQRKLGKQPAKDAIDGVEARLNKAVDAKFGDPLDAYDTTDHERKVTELTESKDSQGIEQIDAQIKALKEAGTPYGVDALKDLRAERVAAENEVVGGIKQKASLIGVLEARKAQGEDGLPANAQDDYQKLREQAQPWIDQFNENHGQMNEGDTFGDDWDTQEVTFDDLAKKFSDEPELLDDFARVQGDSDDAGGDDEASMQQHISDVIMDGDAQYGAQISGRYQAATKLADVMGRYVDAKEAVDASAETTEGADERIAELKTSIETDRGALSESTLKRIDGTLHIAKAGATPEDAEGDTTDTDTGTDASAGSNGGTDGSAGSNGGTKADGANGSNGTQGNGGSDVQRGGSQASGSGNGGVATPNAAGDYTTPKQQQLVLEKARQANLIPDANTSFNKQGEAVYEVQSGDSYWSISERSSGKRFDSNHFATMVNENSKQFGRDPQSGLLYTEDQVVLPNRSVDDLVKLLNLPATPPAVEGMYEGADTQGSGEVADAEQQTGGVTPPSRFGIAPAA